MSRILVIHGPNLNLLGKREPEIYGKVTLNQINRALKQLAKERNVELDIVQTNHEGEIVELIGKAEKNFAGIIINPAGYTHTSVAIRDALEAVKIPIVEVHLSNIYAREDFRHKSLIAPVVDGQVTGFGFYSYLLGLEAILYLLEQK
ncbi:MAG: type II 3-dehydroquinate dehydratase [Candidatus Omnitrophica bacterium]|nr:type II 3-dehydroquinate dehydratase [Candidatus Omnitrophota bacterium]MCM8793175.1 type II 3-dehydroquinate dehydratase [Candidatus Omnitrophota bacterium]